MLILLCFVDTVFTFSLFGIPVETVSVLIDWWISRKLIGVRFDLRLIVCVSLFAISSENANQIFICEDLLLFFVI